MPHFLHLRSVFLLLIFVASTGVAQPTDTRSLMPVPTQATWGQGRYQARTHFTWQAFTPAPGPTASAADSAVAEVVGHFLLPALLPILPSSDAIRQARISSQVPSANLVIQYGRPGNLLALGEDESYTLRVTPMGVALNAPTHLGVLRGLATLRQLVQKDKKNRWLPEVDIVDSPRFPWRGLLIDAARHFMPLPTLKRNLDGMWATKLNVMHWHLSDDQGFRVQSLALPRLHEQGSNGQFYTHAQVREIVAYAAQRGIRVMPEFDMPGHTTAWLAGYPELASNDSTYAPSPRWGVLNIALDPTKETTYQLLDKLLAEMTALFPDPYFHIGGDENDGRQWKRNPRIVQFMRDNKMVTDKGQPDKHALQMYFNRRILQMVTQYNKKMVGWDEILGPDLPADAVIQSWRGRKGLYDAAKAGHATLLSNGYYIDLNYSAASHYAVDPLPQDAPLTPEQRKLVLGGEATMWAEFVDSVIVDSRIWPRAAAVAERFWSSSSVTSVPDMYRRLALVSQELEALGLQHRKAPEQLLLQLAQGKPVEPLRTLASVLEPVKEYKRHFQGFKYTTLTPLNRLVDASLPESDAAREFSTAVDALLVHRATPASPIAATLDARTTLAMLRATLLRWQANDALVQPVLQANSTLTEYASHSTHLKMLATLSLERLTQLEKGQAPSAAWQTAALKQLDAAKAPAGQTELAIVPAVRRLVEAK
ncbi:family 20 glycosylhydrolase [Hymenobacter taeanensis]|uniref:Family 20 glycosylhydrolase n=1 Tax=Hymenobacter taeanensis TaxID=2735321 RepID=A0A6M6BC14_9BACT|nr:MULTISPECIES: family 20 glycosylhydrolase [Hymenobacter]QJX45746.1 family 20 glycosylhydrolase [Hymenobacter taeanensis]UOQ79586.1 beta-N-acetylhexosaminidase [Hymenobacter sp. 5414T-23]